MLSVRNSSRGRSHGAPKIFRAPMYTAHCAVIFAIARLSCIIWLPSPVPFALLLRLSGTVSFFYLLTYNDIIGILS